MDKNLKRQLEDFICERVERDTNWFIREVVEGVGTVTLDYSCDHEGGLEGFYCDTFTGTIHVDNEGYEFELKDVFCNGSELTIDRNEDIDFLPCDEEYVNIFRELQNMPSIILGEPEDYHSNLSSVQIPSATCKIKDINGVVMVDNYSNDYSVQVSKSGTGEYYIAVHPTQSVATNPDPLEVFVEEPKKPVDNKETNIDNTTEQTNEIIKENIMGHVVLEKERKICTVILMDPHPDVKDENSIVAKFDDIVSSKPDNALMMSLAVKHNIQKFIDQYNEVRVQTVDRTILKNTGREVFLEPVEIDDLRWLVK